MQVRLKQHHRIAVGGMSRWHQAGEILDLPDPLAQSLIKDGVAEDPAAAKPAAEEPKPQVFPTRKREYRSK